MKSALRLLLSTLWLVPFTPQTVTAQDLVPAGFGQLGSKVKAGDTLHVADAAGSEIIGKMADLSPSALALIRLLDSPGVFSIRDNRLATGSGESGNY